MNASPQLLQKAWHAKLSGIRAEYERRRALLSPRINPRASANVLDAPDFVVEAGIEYERASAVRPGCLLCAEIADFTAPAEGHGLTISPAAFYGLEHQANVRLLLGHDKHEPLAHSSTGLHCRVLDTRLRVQATVPVGFKGTWRKIGSALAQGHLIGVSVGLPQGSVESFPASCGRFITSARLSEVSLILPPAAPALPSWAAVYQPINS